MDTRKVASEYRMMQWAQRLQEKREKGQSVEEFCVAEGVSRNTYFYWQRKLREAACTELARRDSESDKGLAPNGWTRLGPATEAPTEHVITIEISGCKVAATASTDTELLAQVCRMLKSL